MTATALAPRAANIQPWTFEEGVQRLATLQKEISAYSKAWTSGKLEAGKILLDLRKAAPHGTWEAQLKEICKTAKIGRSTAHNYMDAAEGKAVAADRTTSKNGYPLDELRSYLHKSLRRSDEDAAMQCVVELSVSGKDESTWTLLKDVFPSEDVGLARIGLLAEMDALYKSWKKTKNDRRFHVYRLYLTHAVLLLCRVQKSRTVDSALTAYYNAQKPIVIPEDCKRDAAKVFETPAAIVVPDYAKDKHTASGRKLGRKKNTPKGVNHFFDEGAVLVPETTQPELQDDYREPARQALLAKCKAQKLQPPTNPKSTPTARNVVTMTAAEIPKDAQFEPAFLSEADANAVLSCLTNEPVHYGTKTADSKRQVNRPTPVKPWDECPAPLLHLKARLQQKHNFFFNALQINPHENETTTGYPHYDAPHGTIAMVNVGASGDFMVGGKVNFTTMPAKHTGFVTIQLQHGSLLVFKGKVAHNHGANKERRYSLIFRYIDSFHEKSAYLKPADRIASRKEYEAAQEAWRATDRQALEAWEDRSLLGR